MFVKMLIEIEKFKLRLDGYWIEFKFKLIKREFKVGKYEVYNPAHPELKGPRFYTYDRASRFLSAAMKSETEIEVKMILGQADIRAVMPQPYE